jgi:hypothetical protein
MARYSWAAACEEGSLDKAVGGYDFFARRPLRVYRVGRSDRQAWFVREQNLSAHGFGVGGGDVCKGQTGQVSNTDAVELQSRALGLSRIAVLLPVIRTGQP